MAEKISKAIEIAAKEMNEEKSFIEKLVSLAGELQYSKRDLFVAIIGKPFPSFCITRWYTRK